MSAKERNIDQQNLIISIRDAINKGDIVFSVNRNEPHLIDTIREIMNYEGEARLIDTSGDRLDIIATSVLNSNHGDYLKTVAHAYLKADRWENKRLMQPFWSQMVAKYGLDKEYAGIVEVEVKEFDADE